MKRFLLVLPMLIAVSSCSYQSERHIEQMQAEEQESFFYKENSTEMFTKIDCDGQSDALIKIAKSQIGKDRTLDVYSKLVAMEYLDLATYEYYEQGDKIDGAYFFCKAAKAAKGGYPLPEDIADWKIPRKNFEDLKWGREDFMSMVYNEGLVKDPINMAKAQVAYDCWMEQQSEGLQELDTRICKKEFKDRISRAYNILNGNVSPSDIDAMMRGLGSDGNAQYLDLNHVGDIYYGLLDSANAADIAAAEEAAAIAAAMEDARLAKELEDMIAELDVIEPVLLESVEDSDIEIAMVEETQYNVYFDWNFTKPKNGDKEKIRQVVDNFKKGKFDSMILKAYADKSGPDKVNQKISISRGSTIKDMLIDEGIDERIISYFAFGENATPGPDGVRNAEYRKVIIIFE